MSNTKGFSSFSFSNFNNHFSRISYSKPKLEPLSQKNNIDKSSKDFNEDAQEEMPQTRIDNLYEYKNNSEKEKAESSNAYFENNFNNHNNNNKNYNNNNNNNSANSYFTKSKNVNVPSHNRYNSVTKIDSRNNFNFYGTRSSFNNTKLDNMQFQSLKAAEPFIAPSCNKSLGSSQMPVISSSLNIISSKNKFAENYNSNYKNNYNFNVVLDEKVKNKFLEKDIEKKVERYKIKLNSDMLRILKEEKQREEEREMHYSKASSEMEKRRLESLIALDRVQSSERIIRLNE